MSRKGAPSFASLLDKCVLWATLQDSAGVSGGIDEFPILPSGVTVTNNGTFTKTDLGNNKSVLNFDGSTNYISLTDNDAWFLNGDFTIFFWVKISSYPSLLYIIYDQTAYATNGTIQITITPEGIVGLNLGSSVGKGLNTLGGNNITLNEWNFVCLGRQGNNFFKYVNSWTPYTFTDSIVLYNSTPSLHIGSYFGTGSATLMFSGNLNQLIVWKGRALTQPEIKLLMNRTHPITGAGLMPANGEYWRLT